MELNRSSILHAQGINHGHLPNTPVGPEVKRKRRPENMWMRFSQVVLLFAGTILIVAVLFWIYYGTKTEVQYVNPNKFQAVFLSDGVNNNQELYSTYFGHITAINHDFMVLQDVYYTIGNNTTTSTKTPTATSLQLTKLGCQIDAPYDQMIINRNQVAFWENLQDSGQITKSINNYQAANPNGPNCSPA